MSIKERLMSILDYAFVPFLSTTINDEDDSDLRTLKIFVTPPEPRGIRRLFSTSEASGKELFSVYRLNPGSVDNVYAFVDEDDYPEEPVPRITDITIEKVMKLDDQSRPVGYSRVPLTNSILFSKTTALGNVNLTVVSAPDVLRDVSPVNTSIYYGLLGVSCSAPIFSSADSFSFTIAAVESRSRKLFIDVVLDRSKADLEISKRSEIRPIGNLENFTLSPRGINWLGNVIAVGVFDANDRDLTTILLNVGGMSGCCVPPLSGVSKARVFVNLVSDASFYRNTTVSVSKLSEVATAVATVDSLSTNNTSNDFIQFGKDIQLSVGTMAPLKIKNFDNNSSKPFYQEGVTFDDFLTNVVGTKYGKHFTEIELSGNGSVLMTATGYYRTSGSSLAPSPYFAIDYELWVMPDMEFFFDSINPKPPTNVTSFRNDLEWVKCKTWKYLYTADDAPYVIVSDGGGDKRLHPTTHSYSALSFSGKRVAIYNGGGSSSSFVDVRDYIKSDREWSLSTRSTASSSKLVQLNFNDSGGVNLSADFYTPFEGDGVSLSFVWDSEVGGVKRRTPFRPYADVFTDTGINGPTV